LFIAFDSSIVPFLLHEARRYASRQIRSKIAAMPWPPPMHIVTSA